MAQTPTASKSTSSLFVIGLILAIIGGPILMLPAHLLVNAILGNPAVNTSGMAAVNIVTLLVWPVSIIVGIILIVIGRRKK